jgi:hypothetical protein
MKFSPDCVLCKLLLQPVRHRGNPDGTYDLRSYSFLKHSDWTNVDVQGAVDSALLLVTFPLPISPLATLSAPGFQNTFCTAAGSIGDKKGVFQPRVIPASCDYTIARNWLQNCQRHHDSCGMRPALVKGMKLVDCKTLDIVQADGNSRWIALSYVWGKKESSCDSKPTDGAGRAISRVPIDAVRTVRDAITVTTNLGYRFLWVDQYCIDQESEREKIDQISKMDQIYSGAELTIVAAAGRDSNHGLPGVGITERTKCVKFDIQDATVFSIGPDPFYEITSTKWASRGWTFQESVLSRRLLFFTEYQMVFHCQILSWMEGLTGPELINPTIVDWNNWPVHTRLSGTSRINNHPNNELPRGDYMALVCMYTSRDLTYRFDALKAFSGVANNSRQGDKPICSLSGLPYYQRMGNRETCTSEHTLFTALAWFHESGGYFGQPREAQRRSVFPSWTWAGWDNIVGYHVSGGYRFAESLPNLERVHFENSSGQLIETADLPLWTHVTDLQKRLDDVTVISFEAPVIPVKYFEVHHPADTEYSSWSKHIVRERACASRGGYPTGMMANLVDNIRAGTWACLLLGRQIRQESIFRFLLIIQWVGDKETAERLGSIHVVSPTAYDQSYLPFEDGLGWRRVRLV